MTGDGGEKGARPYLESLGTAGILLGGEGAPSVLGGAVMLEALPAVAGGPAGQLLLLDDAPNAVEPLAAFLARNRWVAYLPARLAEALRDRPPLRGRISTIAPGLSFLVAGAEMDVLPRGPETAGFTVLLDWHGVLLLYPAAPPTTRTAAEWWKTFHLCRFLLPFPARRLSWSG
ncbi:hypothetical protein HS125_04340 [bacterium]|nr:hypothetical protein [bacterium]